RHVLRALGRRRGAPPRPGRPARSLGGAALLARGERHARAVALGGRVRGRGPRPGPCARACAPAPALMAPGPTGAPPPAAPPPRLVRFRGTEPEVGVILRALRATTDGVVEARRLADVLQHEAVLTGRGREGRR